MGDDTGGEGGGRTGRSYGRITFEDLRRLAEIARADREDLFYGRPWYRALGNRLICAALCQGAALHFVDGENGVKDLDVWTFYAARPGHPAYPWRRHASRDFGDGRFGRSPDEPGFVGRHVDLLGRSVEVGSVSAPAAIERRYLSEGRTASARAPARKAVVLPEPPDRLGTVVWPPGSDKNGPLAERAGR